MPVALLLAAVAILAGVVVVAIGRGGELAMFRPDASPRRRELSSAAGIAAFRPPLALFGYSMRATDDALQHVAGAVAERDEQVARLRMQLASLRPRSAEAADPARADPARANPVRAEAADPADPVLRAGPAGARGSADTFDAGTGGFAGAGGPADPAGQGEPW